MFRWVCQGWKGYWTLPERIHHFQNRSLLKQLLFLFFFPISYHSRVAFRSLSELCQFYCWKRANHKLKFRHFWSYKAYFTVSLSNYFSKMLCCIIIFKFDFNRYSIIIISTISFIQLIPLKYLSYFTNPLLLWHTPFSSSKRYKNVISRFSPVVLSYCHMLIGLILLSEKKAY